MLWKKDVNEINDCFLKQGSDNDDDFPMGQLYSFLSSAYLSHIHTHIKECSISGKNVDECNIPMYQV